MTMNWHKGKHTMVAIKWLIIFYMRVRLLCGFQKNDLFFGTVLYHEIYLYIHYSNLTYIHVFHGILFFLIFFDHKNTMFFNDCFVSTMKYIDLHCSISDIYIFYFFIGILFFFFLLFFFLIRFFTHN